MKYCRKLLFKVNGVSCRVVKNSFVFSSSGCSIKTIVDNES